VPRFEREIVIDRPPAEVFAYLSDLANVPEWQGSVVELRPEADAELREGARFTEVRRVAGKRIESTIEVAVLEPGRELTLRVVEGPVPGTVRHLVEPEGDATRLTVKGELAGGGLRSLAGPLLERAARREAEGDLRRLKQTLEAL
jgi:carbon monoxide dehydrogenase subunit G